MARSDNRRFKHKLVKQFKSNQVVTLTKFISELHRCRTRSMTPRLHNTLHYSIVNVWHVYISRCHIWQTDFSQIWCIYEVTQICIYRLSDIKNSPRREKHKTQPYSGVVWYDLRYIPTGLILSSHRYSTRWLIAWMQPEIRGYVSISNKHLVESREISKLRDPE